LWRNIYDARRDACGRGHDEAAGAKPGTSPVDRPTVNVGTVRVPLPSEVRDRRVVC
jgi:hypothetical protein